MKNFNPEDYVIFKCLGGSRLYGTDTADSDFDFRSVCLSPLDVLIDPFMNFEVKDSFDGEDKTIYDLGTFIKLAADNNPNILELLFCPREKIIYSNLYWDYILKNRGLFLSKNVKHRFLGYAVSQIKALERHRQWFINPPTHKPTRAEFGLAESPRISMAWLNSTKASVNFNIIKDEYVDEIRKEELFREAVKKWDGYDQWQKNRNPKRKHSEEKYGYDGKYASHAFRLLEEGKQLLMDGEIHFPLQNAKFLLDIKNGVYQYEYIINKAKEIEDEFEGWYALSHLPQKPDRVKLKEIYVDLVRRSL